MGFYNFWVRLFDYCRVSVLVTLAGGAILLLVGQGVEITVRLGESGWQQFGFVAAVSFWAWQGWFWSRLMLNDRFEDILKPTGGRSGKRAPTGRDGDYCNLTRARRIIAGFPRFLGTLAYALAITSMLRNGLLFEAGFWALCITAALSLAYWTFRGDISHKRLLGFNMPDLKPKDFTIITHTWLAFTSLIVVGSLIWATCNAVGMGFTLGSGVIVFTALACIAAVGNTLVFLTKKQGFPLVIVMITFAGLWSGFDVNDNHGVRTIEPNAAPIEALPLPNAFEQWQKVNGQNEPFVIVATSGGGLRAAYWTATALGALQDANPKFADRVFAISSVSGGSLGAMIFNGVLASGVKECHGRPARNGPPSGDKVEILDNCVEALALSALHGDFLAPSVAAMVNGDLMHRFLPLGFPDRAAALEGGWEARWKSVMGKDRMASGFRNLWTEVRKRWMEGKPSWLPALLLNGTHEETGRRIVTSNLRIDSKFFPDTFDFYAPGTKKDLPFTVGEISAATAAHNSARFSYISPAGTLHNGAHIIDGGYFENYGAQSLSELLDAVLDGLKNPDWHKGEQKLLTLGADQPILIIQITNDPSPKDQLASNDPSGRGKSAPWFNETAAPVRGLLNTRNARGVSAAKQLKNRARNQRIHYAHFRLHRPPSEEEMTEQEKEEAKRKGWENTDPKLALGWVLSADSECAMQLQLRARHNQEAFKKVYNILLGNNPKRELPKGVLPEGIEALAKICKRPASYIEDWSFVGKEQPGPSG